MILCAHALSSSGIRGLYWLPRSSSRQKKALNFYFGLSLYLFCSVCFCFWVCNTYRQRTLPLYALSISVYHLFRVASLFKYQQHITFYAFFDLLTQCVSPFSNSTYPGSSHYNYNSLNVYIGNSIIEKIFQQKISTLNLFSM